VRPAGLDYHCDISEDKVQTAGNVGPIDGQPPAIPRTPAPSTDSREDEERSEGSENTIKSGALGNTIEED